MHVVKLKNMKTFYKNLILIIITVVERKEFISIIIIKIIIIIIHFLIMVIIITILGIELVVEILETIGILQRICLQISFIEIIIICQIILITMESIIHII